MLGDWCVINVMAKSARTKVMGGCGVNACTFKFTKFLCPILKVRFSAQEQSRNLAGCRGLLLSMNSHKLNTHTLV
jgi:hypothetical protein